MGKGERGKEEERSVHCRQTLDDVHAERRGGEGRRKRGEATAFPRVLALVICALREGKKEGKKRILSRLLYGDRERGG